MSSEEHATPNYMAIFWWLLALTVIEIGWALMPHACYFLDPFFSGGNAHGTVVACPSAV